ncbi:hypothetical protein ZOSMA_49G00140 [Zostera marina]|uniref:Uncharacterized protein n=1 Tax=Zostera marina TaxID=29655 RepID=A0A0K9NYQ3_ZOSMR|nr:hypothetical protein ZOSMA_49G00140 [Zostera marina]
MSHDLPQLGRPGRVKHIDHWSGFCPGSDARGVEREESGVTCLSFALSRNMTEVIGRNFKNRTEYMSRPQLPPSPITVDIFLQDVENTSSPI